MCSCSVSLTPLIKETLFYPGVRKNFMGLSLQAREIKAKINKWNLIKLKSFGLVKETIKPLTKQKATYWLGKICLQYVQKRGY